eukprot:Hpha_TRINITY_DN16023_c4_g3::TRINITY_DN16023_c4_g3_i1::g.119975::m.119975
MGMPAAECSAGVSAAAALRVEGNEALKAGQAEKAMGLYSRALECELPGSDRAVLLCNRAAARLRAKGEEAAGCALVDAAAALQCDPSSAKGPFRQAQALSRLADLHADRIHTGVQRWEASGGVERELVALGCGLPVRSDWTLRLAAQDCLLRMGTAGERDAGVRTALTSARDKALRAAYRGPVEVRRDGAHSGGLGLFTTREVRPGEVLLEDAPVVFHRGEGNFQERGKSVVAELELLAEKDPLTVEWVRGLHNPAEDCSSLREELFCIWDRNGHSVGDVDFRVEEDSAVGVALYIAGSRVNHSCRPNAVQVFCPRTGRIRILLLDTLPGGAEVFISYVAPYASRSSRRSRLRFDCRCELCEAKQDDAPLGGGDPEEVKQLQEALERAQQLAKEVQSAGHADARARGALVDEAQKCALAAAAEAVAKLGEEHEVSFGATLLCVKLCAGAGSALALPHARRLHALAAKHLHPHWPLQVSARVHLAVHEGIASPDNEEKLLPLLHDALAAHKISIGCPFPDDSARRPGDEPISADDAVGYFWRRYRAELSALEIDTVDRARLLFSSKE